MKKVGLPRALERDSRAQALLASWAAAEPGPDHGLSCASRALAVEWHLDSTCPK